MIAFGIFNRINTEAYEFFYESVKHYLHILEDLDLSKIVKVLNYKKFKNNI